MVERREYRSKMVSESQRGCRVNSATARTHLNSGSSSAVQTINLETICYDVKSVKESTMY